MDERRRHRIQLFDRQQDLSILERRRPHWSQAGTLAFITWRTWDSLPAEVLDRWTAECDDWLRERGVDPGAADGALQLEKRASQLSRRFRQFRSTRWHHHLDALRGECVLRRPELSQEVAQNLRHFDLDCYVLTDFIVIPNHVHLLAAFPDEDAMVARCRSWKRYTAKRINRALGRKGRFWQSDAFDHLVRSVE